MKNIPMDKEILHKWLTGGLIEERKLFPTHDGTPQGGVISPTLANMALDGLENILHEKFPKTKRKPYSPKVNYVRYADDFIITGATKELLEDEVMPIVEKFMRERGLSLSKIWSRKNTTSTKPPVMLEL